MKDCNMGAETMCSGGNQKISATDGGNSNWRHNQPIGSSRMQRPSTRDISSRGERPQIPWCVTVEVSTIKHILVAHKLKWWLKIFLNQRQSIYT